MCAWIGKHAAGIRSQLFMFYSFEIINTIVNPNNL